MAVPLQLFKVYSRFDWIFLEGEFRCPYYITIGSLIWDLPSSSRLMYLAIVYGDLGYYYGNVRTFVDYCFEVSYLDDLCREFELSL